MTVAVTATGTETTISMYTVFNYMKLEFNMDFDDT